MRPMAAVGFVVGLMMMAAPLWGPRLGLGTVFGVSLAAPDPLAAPAPVVAPGHAPVADAMQGIVAALDRARGLVGVPAAGLVGGDITGGIAITDDAADQACRDIAQAGHMTDIACRAQVGALMPEALGAQGSGAQTPGAQMGEVEQAMQGIRRFGPTTAPSRHPGAKFVKVEK